MRELAAERTEEGTATRPLYLDGREKMVTDLIGLTPSPIYGCRCGRRGDLHQVSFEQGGKE